MTRRYLVILAYAIMWLFVVQCITALVEAVYMLELLNTSLDEKVLGIVFLLSPFLLFLFGRRASRSVLWIAGALLVAARAATPYLGTVGRMATAGIGAGAGLILLPLMLTAEPENGGRKGGLLAAQGLALAVGLSTMLRTLGATFDVSMSPAASWIGWALGALLIALLRPFSAPLQPEKQGPQAGAFSAGLGISAVLGLFYFVLSSPGVIARWTQGSYAVIVSAASLLSLGWCALALWRPDVVAGLGRGWLALWNVGFGLALVGTLLAHRINFPPSPGSAPVVVGDPSWLQQVPLALMLLLFPVVFVDLAVLAGRVARKRLSPRRLAPGFAMGALLLLVLTFANIFTNVWGYVPPVSGFFRNKYWLPFLVLAAVMGLAAVLRGREAQPGRSETRTPILFPALVLGALFVATLVLALRTGRTTSSPEDGNRLTVMTYNIQQGVDDEGEKAHQRQLALMRQVGGDIIGLQENDSARISLGNNDLVRYFAHHLGYHAYYGPKTVAGTYGTAVLSRYPLEDCLSFFTYSDQDEIGTVEIEVRVGERAFAIYNVHPDGSDEAKLAMVDAVLSRAADEGYVIALGDYNARGWEEPYLRMGQVYTNAWMSIYPTGIDNNGLDMSGRERIDHIFLSPHLRVIDAVYLPKPESHSDHPAHWAVIGW